MADLIRARKRRRRLVRRECCGADGAFRARLEDREFDKLYAGMVRELEGRKLASVAGRIDRYVYDQALVLLLCAPRVLYAVNKHVKFGPYRTTFELAETEVDDEHWSRHCGKGGDSGGAQRATRGKSTTGCPGAGC
jgi:hypothetical protein